MDEKICYFGKRIKINILKEYCNFYNYDEEKKIKELRARGYQIKGIPDPVKRGRVPSRRGLVGDLMNLEL